MKVYRQGEILVKELTKEEFQERMERTWSPLKEVEGGVIREGEKSGHKHEVKEGVLYSDAQGNLYIKAKDLAQFEGYEGLKITHPEHKALKLEGKYYQVGIQREYDEAKHSRAVMD